MHFQHIIKFRWRFTKLVSSNDRHGIILPQRGFSDSNQKKIYNILIIFQQ